MDLGECVSVCGGGGGGGGGVGEAVDVRDVMIPGSLAPAC